MRCTCIRVYIIQQLYITPVRVVIAPSPSTPHTHTLFFSVDWKACVYLVALHTGLPLRYVSLVDPKPSHDLYLSCTKKQAEIVHTCVYMYMYTCSLVPRLFP